MFIIEAQSQWRHNWANNWLNLCSLTQRHKPLMPCYYYLTLALIFKSPTGLMSCQTRAPELRQIYGCLALASRCWSSVCELFKDVRRLYFKISSMLNIGSHEKSNSQWETKMENIGEGSPSQGTHFQHRTLLLSHLYTINGPSLWSQVILSCSSISTEKICPLPGPRPWKTTWWSCGRNICGSLMYQTPPQMGFGDQTFLLAKSLTYSQNKTSSCVVWKAQWSDSLIVFVFFH